MHSYMAFKVMCALQIAMRTQKGKIIRQVSPAVMIHASCVTDYEIMHESCVTKYEITYNYVLQNMRSCTSYVVKNVQSRANDSYLGSDRSYDCHHGAELSSRVTRQCLHQFFVYFVYVLLVHYVALLLHMCMYICMYVYACLYVCIYVSRSTSMICRCMI